MQIWVITGYDVDFGPWDIEVYDSYEKAKESYEKWIDIMKGDYDDVEVDGDTSRYCEGYSWFEIQSSILQ